MIAPALIRFGGAHLEGLTAGSMVGVVVARNLSLPLHRSSARVGER
jgi:hypothetical protein